MTAREHARSFELFGSDVRVLIGAPLRGERRPPELAALEIEAMLRGVHRELTRFDPASALSALNSDPASEVRTTRTVALLVSAAREAALDSHGLVDCSLVDELERAGYASSRVGARRAALRDALVVAPPPRPATGRDASPWGDVSVDVTNGIVRRPPGMRFDSGGVGKGLAADLAAARLRNFSSFAIDCGGDIRIGGAAGLERSVEVVHPLDAEVRPQLLVAAGGVATSGLRSRIWEHDGGFSHHLIDPGGGRPAWTGLVQATALAPTAARAEVLAKAALLQGPDGARRTLARHGGLIVLNSGETEMVGELRRPALEAVA